MGSCGTNPSFCRLGREKVKKHQSVTLCGRCIDATDTGNLMFGVGMAARGYNQSFVFTFAQIYNLRADGLSPKAFNEDPRMAPAGWMIVAHNAYYSNENFCGILNTANQRYGGIHEDAETAGQCKACESESLSPLFGHTPSNKHDLLGLKQSVSSNAGPLKWFGDNFYPLLIQNLPF